MTDRSFARRLGVCALIAGLATTSLAGCSDSSEPDAATDSSGGSSSSGTNEAVNEEARAELPADIVDSGELRVVTDFSIGPPLVIPAEGSGDPTGYEIDMGKALAETLGLEYTVINTPFASILSSLQAGRGDVGMSNINDTLEREEIVDFVNYGNKTTGLIVQTGNPADLAGYESLCGKTAAGLANSIAEAIVDELSKCEEQGKEPAKTILYPSAEALLSSLASGRVDGLVADQLTAEGIAASKPEVFEALEGSFVPFGVEGAAIVKGNDELVSAVKLAFESMIESGTYEEIFEKYDMPEVSQISEITVNGATE